MKAALLLVAAATHAAIAQRPSDTIVTSNINDNTASLVDAGSGRTVATLPTGEGPHEVAISRDGRTARHSFRATRSRR